MGTMRRRNITGRGMVVTGLIQSGSIKMNDYVCLKRTNGVVIRCQITGIEMDRKLHEAAHQGDAVGLLLRGIRKKEVGIGDVLVEDGGA